MRTHYTSRSNTARFRARQTRRDDEERRTYHTRGSNVGGSNIGGSNTGGSNTGGSMSKGKGEMSMWTPIVVIAGIVLGLVVCACWSAHEEECE